jgi:hypothetical protein
VALRHVAEAKGRERNVEMKANSLLVSGLLLGVAGLGGCTVTVHNPPPSAEPPPAVAEVDDQAAEEPGETVVEEIVEVQDDPKIVYVEIETGPDYFAHHARLRGPAIINFNTGYSDGWAAATFFNHGQPLADHQIERLLDVGRRQGDPTGKLALPGYQEGYRCGAKHYHNPYRNRLTPEQWARQREVQGLPTRPFPGRKVRPVLTEADRQKLAERRDERRDERRKELEAAKAKIDAERKAREQAFDQREAERKAKLENAKKERELAQAQREAARDKKEAEFKAKLEADRKAREEERQKQELARKDRENQLKAKMEAEKKARELEHQKQEQARKDRDAALKAKTEAARAKQEAERKQRELARQQKKDERKEKIAQRKEDRLKDKKAKDGEDAEASVKDKDESSPRPLVRFRGAGVPGVPSRSGHDGPPAPSSFDRVR